jgi:hypothetical protein
MVQLAALMVLLELFIVVVVVAWEEAYYQKLHFSLVFLLRTTIELLAISPMFLFTLSI